MNKTIANMSCKEYGEYLGYPECCIESFINNRFYKSNIQQLAIDLINIGFVPCHKHALEIFEGKYENLSKLLRNREEFSNIKLPKKSIPMEKLLNLLDEKRKISKSRVFITDYLFRGFLKISLEDYF